MVQTVSRDQRFRRYGEQCPICGGHAGTKQGIGERCAGYISSDQEYAFCTREEYATGDLERNESTTPASFKHKLYGPCNCGKEHNPARASSNGHKSHTSNSRDERRIIAEYSYQDERGRLVYQAVRFDPKGFSQRRPGQKGYTWNMQGVNYVPYRLPDLLRNRDATVFVVEGEKDADNLAHIGLVATTNVGGAGKWREEYNHWLKGRHVVILPDNDKAGQDHAKMVAESLAGVAASIRIVNLPGLPEKGDVSDWLADGGTKEALEALSQPPKRKFLYASEVHPEPVDYLWTKRLAKGMLTLLVGDPGLGKGLVCATIAAETTRGSRLPDGKASEPGGIVIMSPEDSYEHTIVPRLIAAGADLRKVILLSEVPDFDSDGNQYNRPISFPDDAGILEEAIIDCKASLAIIDPVLAMVNGKYDTHKDQEARIALSRVLTIAKRQGCVVLGIFHLNKMQSGNVLYRSAASIAFIAMARIGLFLVPDPDDLEHGRVLVNYKNNLAAKATSLRFTIEQTPEEMAYIRWNGESSYTEQELLNQVTPTDNPRSEQESGLIEVLRENGLAMTPADIHEKLQVKQSLNALEQMLKRKLEQGVLIRPSRGLYTYNGNPLYSARSNDVSNESNVSLHSNESNVSSSNIADSDMSVLGNGHKAASDEALAKTDITDMTIDKEVAVSLPEIHLNGHEKPFHVGQMVNTPKGWGKVFHVNDITRRVSVALGAGYDRQNYPFEQVQP